MRIVVAGAGAIGASVAYHLASLGAREVTLVDRGGIASGATAKAMGGIRQQFSTAAEVRLAQANIRFFEELGAPLFEQIDYLFLATTEDGLAELDERQELQTELGVPVERVDPSFVADLRTDRRTGRRLLRDRRRRRPAGGDARAGPARAQARGRAAGEDRGCLADGVYGACGFSGHGFMQSPAVGRALAEEILGLTPSLDLAPYRLNRFETGAGFPEQLIL